MKKHYLIIVVAIFFPIYTMDEPRIKLTLNSYKDLDFNHLILKDIPIQKERSLLILNADPEPRTRQPIPDSYKTLAQNIIACYETYLHMGKHEQIILLSVQCNLMDRWRGKCAHNALETVGKCYYICRTQADGLSFYTSASDKIVDIIRQRYPIVTIPINGRFLPTHEEVITAATEIGFKSISTEQKIFEIEIENKQSFKDSFLQYWLSRIETTANQNIKDTEKKAFFKQMNIDAKNLLIDQIIKDFVDGNKILFKTTVFLFEK